MKVRNAVIHLRVIFMVSALATPQNEFILLHLSRAWFVWNSDRQDTIFLIRKYKKKQTDFLPCCWKDVFQRSAT
jgi:hypothetical protein